MHLQKRLESVEFTDLHFSQKFGVHLCWGAQRLIILQGLLGLLGKLLLEEPLMVVAKEDEDPWKRY